MRLPDELFSGSERPLRWTLSFQKSSRTEKFFRSQSVGNYSGTIIKGTSSLRMSPTKEKDLDELFEITAWKSCDLARFPVQAAKRKDTVTGQSGKNEASSA